MHSIAPDLNLFYGMMRVNYLHNLRDQWVNLMYIKCMHNRHA